jgi:putative nucleotidyltransferase with HDIG domain
MVAVHNDHLKYYFETPLYYKAGEGIGFELYKPAFVFIQDVRIRNEKLPPKLFVHINDKSSGLRELQRGLNVQLENDLKSHNPEQIKETLIGLVHETIREPTKDGVQGAVSTMEIVFAEYLNNRHVIDKLVHVISRDYTTAAHSVNVMALMLRFCTFCGMGAVETKRMGLSALLHDVGKVKVSNRLLKASRRLTDIEFEAVKKHTVFGYEILKGCNLPEDICLCALNHHERLDGSGYPNGVTDITEEAQTMGFIDCYEALTCNERPYRNAVRPFDALSHIKKELFQGNFGGLVFERFVKSLG